jgi:NAD(P)-dependent dehydrogenase (short-subunit alcohol dehydrogenase family)
MIEEVHQHFGLVDILVNNAGGAARQVPFAELDEASRRFDIDLNINGVVNCCQAVAKDMLGRGGSIINISSNASLDGESSAGNNAAHYGAVKGFMNSLSKILAWDWAKQGVRVNNICPGWIVPHSKDDVGGGSFWGRALEQIGSPEDMERAMQSGSLPGMSSLPIKRLGRPEDVAYLALFLASERSSYITGQLISVSGGAYMP